MHEPHAPLQTHIYTPNTGLDTCEKRRSEAMTATALRVHAHILRHELAEPN
jgi:hypothetical protein